ncbi:MAG: hypothetical protein MUF10_07440 [Thermoanaerobaculaceae bacterium]|jgi:hypothetical protein|nr:hypothetical protein [Thermoanaerobaculaceae bacterium]
MGSELVPRALLRWDGFTLRIDLDMLELQARRVLAERAPFVELRRIGGQGGVVEIDVVAVWHGFRFAGTVRLSELRLRRRFLGCRVDGLHGPMSVPVPLGLLSRILRTSAGGLLQLDADDRILLVDLREHLPSGIEVGIAEVRCQDRWLELDVAPGFVAAAFTSRFASHAQ